MFVAYCELPAACVVAPPRVVFAIVVPCCVCIAFSMYEVMLFGMFPRGAFVVWLFWALL